MVMFRIPPDKPGDVSKEDIMWIGWFLDEKCPKSVKIDEICTRVAVKYPKVSCARIQWNYMPTFQEIHSFKKPNIVFSMINGKTQKLLKNPDEHDVNNLFLEVNLSKEKSNIFLYKELDKDRTEKSLHLPSTSKTGKFVQTPTVPSHPPSFSPQVKKVICI